MGIRKQLSRYASRRITRRLYRTMPWIGSVLAIVTLGKAVRRKGLVGGTVDTALDFIPFVGGVKNLAELGRGRDLIPDKSVRRS
jgi:putative toxin of predicted polymorphic toxin system